MLRRTKFSDHQPGMHSEWIKKALITGLAKTSGQFINSEIHSNIFFSCFLGQDISSDKETASFFIKWNNFWYSVKVCSIPVLSTIIQYKEAPSVSCNIIPEYYCPVRRKKIKDNRFNFIFFC